jgi:tRNA (mo5U34)-methyltransferase
MAINENPNLNAIWEKVSRKRWYHSYELVPGVITPGSVVFDARKILNGLQIPTDLSGKRALDIGTWDGPMAFELESRGAEVFAVDIQDPDRTGFNTAKEIRKSNIKYFQTSVYNLSSLNFPGEFDIISFFGVFYHLKHPLAGLEEISKVMADNALLLFEGECLRQYAETLEGAEVKDIDIPAIANSSAPLTLCYPGKYKGQSNWFIPNFTCLKSWFEAVSLEIVKYYFDESSNLMQTPLTEKSSGKRDYPVQRISGFARKRREGIIDEHPLM